MEMLKSFDGRSNLPSEESQEADGLLYKQFNKNSEDTKK